MEKLVLTTPITFPNLIDWQVSRLELDWGNSIITVIVKSNTGIFKGINYTGIDAQDKMIALNKANLTIKSLHRRIIEILQADGHLDGTISGVPD